MTDLGSVLESCVSCAGQKNPSDVAKPHITTFHFSPGLPLDPDEPQCVEISNGKLVTVQPLPPLPPPPLSNYKCMR